MSLVTLDIQKHIAFLTLNRPDALNSLNSEVFSALEAALAEIERAPQVRAVILTGGGRDFAAGADIAEMRRFTPEDGRQFSARGSAILQRLELLPPPVIAAVNGFALGGGCELAMACDIRLAESNARFSMPETGLGILPGFGGTQRMARICGSAKAMELIFTGRMIDAYEAKEIGLVSEVYQPEELPARARDLAQRISEKAPLAVQAAKAAVLAGLRSGPSVGYATESEAFAFLCGTQDRNEGMDAFKERRKQRQFTGT